MTRQDKCRAIAARHFLRIHAVFLERVIGLEPTTFCLGSRHVGIAPYRREPKKPGFVRENRLVESSCIALRCDERDESVTK